MLRIPHCLDSRLVDDSKVVSPTDWSCSTLQKHYFSASGTHLYYTLSEPHGLVWPEGLGKLKKFIYLIRSRTRDLPACSIAPSSYWDCITNSSQYCTNCHEYPCLPIWHYIASIACTVSLSKMPVNLFSLVQTFTNCSSKLINSMQIIFWKANSQWGNNLYHLSAWAGINTVR
jgi:hypothetical protein